MSSHDSPRTSIGPPSLPNLGLRSRRGSLVSLSSSAPVDKEQLAHALDQIHSTASHSEALTTFNEFASPPPSSSTVENKSLAEDIMQNGLSGLYNRFRGVVAGGKDKSAPTSHKGDSESIETASATSQNATTPTSKGSIALMRDDSGATVSPIQLSTSSSRLQSPTAISFAANSSESTLQASKSSKGTFISTPATSKSASSSRPSIAPMAKATASSVIVPTVAQVTVSAFKDGDTTQILANIPSASDRAEPSPSVTDLQGYDARHLLKEGVVEVEASDSSGANPGLGNPTQEGFSGDGGLEGRKKSTSNPQSALSALSSLQTSDSARLNAPSRLTVSDSLRRPAAIERIAQSHLPGYQASRASSTDRSTAAASPINTSAHNSVRHETNSAEEFISSNHQDPLRIPGTTMNEGGTDIVSAKLEKMRRQVLSKEFWMADEICKECFLCGDAFSAFRRKHHCRTCGCIFDSKCTSIVSGQRFGVQGTLRVCKTCLDIINRRHDSSGSDDSGDESALQTFFQNQHAKFDTSNKVENAEEAGHSVLEKAESDKSSLATPMMAIPATRRIGNSANRQSLVLNIETPQLSRPSSSRSLKSVAATGRPASSNHKRHQSKHNFLVRFMPTAEERAPFHRGVTDDLTKKSRLPAFHDDNIIDPDLAPYMSDEGSSGDEQMSIFATMNSGGLPTASFENDRSGFGSLLSANKKHRTRTGEKSVSGVSFTSRGGDEANGNPSISGFSRQNRRRNLSTASNSLHHSRVSPRQLGSGYGNLNDAVSDIVLSTPTAGSARLTRSASMRDARAPVIELNSASLHHVRRLLHQLLQDENIPNIASWERALMPILLQCTDDVNPDVRGGDDIDIRHYVKLKKIPGGKPGDTSYVSGVVFSKNLALKSMPRSISNPRIVIVSFPIEYQRHQQHFMSLEPVIAQEKEFLRNMVNRIASLRPQLLLVQKHISGLALQYLAEANIAVAYNVKQSVIEAVSRCAQTEIISSIDMVALKPVHIGKSAGFEVKTFVHNDIPGKKKTYIYLSGCPKELGCTITLRGANLTTLAKMKRITEFMVYVVYNLKLETCLMRDELVLIPDVAEGKGSLMRQESSQTVQGLENLSTRDHAPVVSDQLQSDTEIGKKSLEQNSQHKSFEPTEGGIQDSTTLINPGNTPLEVQNESMHGATGDSPKVISAHEAHVHGSHEDQLPGDIPMPTFYSDMVAKHKTKILSASPFVKFKQPYLLMRAREQERRLVYLKRLRDQDTYEEPTENDQSKPQKFQLIKPEMVHETVKRAPRQIMEVLHAVHDAEYDKALHNYQTQTRQWENSIQRNIYLFDPYAHQNITVLYTVVCTDTTIPCAGPDLLELAFYNEHEESTFLGPDCTLGQYVEDLCLSANTVCASNGCERKMSEHHRTYVHGEARVTVFVEKYPCKINGLQDSILMWSYCKICKKETQVMPMSENTWKYSLGKYLELSFWSSELRLRAGFCPHDIHRDHLRYFGFRNFAVRIHYDPIDLLEIIVPRARITWKVDLDLKLKNDMYLKIEERWNRFMTSVNSRIKGINIDSVVPEKAEACKAEVERLTKLAQEEHAALTRKLQAKYMESKYYEIIPLNRALRAMQEKVAEWDDAFAAFDANYFPSEKDIRRLAALQLKRMFMDRDESATSLASAESADLAFDADEKSPTGPQPPNVSAEEASDVLTSLIVESSDAATSAEHNATAQIVDQEGVNHLDLALPQQNEPIPITVSDVPEANSALNPANLLNPDTVSQSQLSGSDDSTLLEKVERLRAASQKNQDGQSSRPQPTGTRIPIERGASRRSGVATSPPLARTQSQPAGTLHRLQPSPTKSPTKQGESKMGSESHGPVTDPLKSSTEPAKQTEKKLSDRLGLSTLKAHRKAGHSLIPRSIHSKRKESKVSTLAKHFEQLSREFEKERLRDRKQRAATISQARAFPKASAKPIVEVYDDINEAVEERGDLLHTQLPQAGTDQSGTQNGGPPNLNPESTRTSNDTQSPTSTTATANETATETETDDNQHNVSAAGSDDDGAVSDVENALLDDIIPGAAEIAESLRKPDAEIPLEIPRHEKSSLMKMLTNFWAERSASGWTPLEYPVNAGDHIFADEDIIVREDEPSSLIAFTLQSEHYRTMLEELRSQGSAGKNGHNGPSAEKSHQSETEGGNAAIEEDKANEAEVETSLLRATGTHLAYSFVDSTARMQCKIFFAEQFDAVRRKCGVADRIVESLSRCLKWDSKGGKTKSVFLKTLDDRLIVKSLSPVETQAFLKFAPAYFNIMAEALFHDLPTVIAKMLGFYQIVIKNPVTGTEIKWDVLVMENLFYDRSPTRIFDLKGSMRNRKIQSTGEQNEVLLDENMVEFIYESPLFVREVSSLRDTKVCEQYLILYSTRRIS